MQIRIILTTPRIDPIKTITQISVIQTIRSIHIADQVTETVKSEVLGDAMGWFNRHAPIDEESEWERLSRLSEKEFLIELVLQLEKVNRKCDDISRKIVIWSN